MSGERKCLMPNIGVKFLYFHVKPDKLNVYTKDVHNKFENSYTQQYGQQYTTNSNINECGLPIALLFLTGSKEK